MRTKGIVVAGIVVAVLLCIAILAVVNRPPSSTITVRHVKSVQSGGLVSAIFEITNHTTSRYFVYPMSVEVRNGLAWKKCFDFVSFPGPFVVPHGSESSTFYMTNLPTDCPLRLRMGAGKELTGLKGLFARFELRILGGARSISLNPFDETSSVFSKRIQILSDEFMNSEK